MNAALLSLVFSPSLVNCRDGTAAAAKCFDSTHRAQCDSCCKAAGQKGETFALGDCQCHND